MTDNDFRTKNGLVVNGTLIYAPGGQPNVAIGSIDLSKGTLGVNGSLYAQTAVLVGSNASVSATGTILLGNSSVNTTITQTGLSVSNATSSTVANSGTLSVASVVVANSTLLQVGANSIVGLGSYFAGNSTANSVLNSSSLLVRNATDAVTITTSYINVGANLALNTSSLYLGNSSVNALVNTSYIGVGASGSALIGTVQISPTIVTIGGGQTINSTAITGSANNTTYLATQPGSYYTNASNISTGTLPSARLSGTYSTMTANNSTYFGGQLPSYYYQASNPTGFITAAGSCAYASNTGQLNGQYASYYYPASNPNGYVTAAATVAGATNATYAASAGYATSAGTATNLSGLASSTTGGVTTLSGVVYFSPSPVYFYSGAGFRSGAITMGGADNIAMYYDGGSAGVVAGDWISSGNIYAAGAITAYYSDIRVKAVIGNIPSALAKVKSLNGVYYTINELGKSLNVHPGDDDKQKVGVLAHQVQAIMPEVVKIAPFDRAPDGTSKSGENYLTVQYEMLIPLLIEAIKELSDQVDALKKG